MPYIVGLIDGMESVRFVPLSEIDKVREELFGLPYTWFIEFDMHSKLDANDCIKVQVTQKSNDFDPQNLQLKLTWWDSYYEDV
ncbi:hypothetical protein I6M70_17275, partial [Acinetobacter pittii]|uniref:hypothetical protein n=1 Tax=Acinetobacter pittii TaxID=48296 RepID=UPI0019003C7C